MTEMMALDKQLAEANVIVDKSLTVHTSKTLKGELDQLKDILARFFSKYVLTKTGQEKGTS